MQPPPVQYVMTSDGVRIAYTVSGEGPPLVFCTEPLVSHTQLEWTHPLFSRIYARLAERNTLIRLDVRGTGLSERPTQNPAMHAYLLDVDAVVQRLALPRFSIGAVQVATLSVLKYAAEHRDSIDRMVIADGFSRLSDLGATSMTKALAAAAAADFWLATEAIGAAALGAGRDEVRDYGAYIRACIGPEHFVRTPGPSFEDWDTTPLLADLDAPALVLRHTGLQYVTAEMTRDLAARLPNARYQELPGSWADEPEGVADAINDFLHGTKPPDAAPAERAASGLRAILFTDIEGHTSMMQRLGDGAGRDVLREHERITREILRAHDGAEVKAMGDGFMASFGSVASAAECAVALQRAFSRREGGEPIAVRIGLNAGEPIAEDDDLFGSSVIMAARIAAHARGGEILVSDTVRGLLSGKGFLFSDRGETALRGFEDPVRLYEVRWGSAG